MRNLPKIFLRSLENVAPSAWEESRTSTDERTEKISNSEVHKGTQQSFLSETAVSSRLQFLVTSVTRIVHKITIECHHLVTGREDPAVLTRPGYDMMVRVSTCRPISSALSTQGCLRHAANMHDVWFQIVFVCRPIRMEPTTCRHSRDLLCFDF